MMNPYNRYLCSLVALLCYYGSVAQTHEETYIQTTQYLVPTQNETTHTGTSQLVTDDQKLVNVTYLDRLGRTKQVVNKQAGGQKEDLISYQTYDDFGRSKIAYLPYIRATSSLNYELPEILIPNQGAQYLSLFPNELNAAAPNAYSETQYESSALHRVLKQAAPGDAWKIDPTSNADHSIKSGYATNTLNPADPEVFVNPQGVQFDNVKQFSVTHPNNVKAKTELYFNGYYAPNTLFKTIIKDENWQPQSIGLNLDHTTEEFKDNQGRVVLKRTYERSTPHDTYYVYDDYGKLTYVIPPLASDEIIVVGGQSFQATPQNFPWTKLALVDEKLADEYEKLLLDYKNEDILNADLTNKYNAQGGFTISTVGEELLMSINFTAGEALPLKTGSILDLNAFGKFKDSELGRTPDGSYTFFIKNNSIWCEAGRNAEKLTSLNTTFSNATMLNYDINYSWASLTEIDRSEADTYLETLNAQKVPNSDYLTVVIQNPYNGVGGFNVSINENDLLTLTLTIQTSSSIRLKQGVVAHINTKRKLADRYLGTIGGYNFHLKDNAIIVEGNASFNSLTGTLTATNPPTKTTNTQTVEGLCYIYHYDYRHRLVEKKIPGKDWEYIIYDKLNRPILVQDGNLRLNHQWIFTKYDAFDRVVYSGLYEHNSFVNRASLQSFINTNINNGTNTLSEVRAAASTLSSDTSTQLYYSNTAFPKTNITLFAVNYYDDYSPNTDADLNYSDSYNQGVSNHTKTLPTLNQVRVLDTDDWVTSATYYDKKSRPIYVVTKNSYLGTLDKLKTHLDFSGSVKENWTYHKKGVQPAILTSNVFTYDHANRLLTQIQTINNGTPELIVNNHYNALGQLIHKNVGGTVATVPENSNGLQTVNYKYTLRGWLESINDGGTLGSDLFGFKLHYNTISSDNAYEGLYNGNISETHWKTANDNIARRYYYDYDALNRIKAGDYHNTYNGSDNLIASENFNVQDISYDKNGNILTLERTGRFYRTSFYTGLDRYDIIDDLSYMYEPLSNKLTSVSDASSRFGFNDQNTGSEDYLYDINGNLTKDANKKISNIGYNHLNLPVLIEFENTANTIRYVYDATGVKLKKEVLENSETTVTEYAGAYVYKDALFEFMPQPEGYIQQNDQGEYAYVYQYKDHLGNIRLSYRALDNYQRLIDNSFDENYEGWSYNGGSVNGNIELENDRLRVNVTNQWNGAEFDLEESFSPGDEIKIEFDFEDGTSDKPRLVIRESDANGQNFTWYTIYADLTEDHYSYTHTVVAGENIKIKFDKSNVSNDLGQSTYFYIDNMHVSIGTLEMVEENNYYPFGLEHKGYNNIVSSNANSVASKFKYNGKEFNEELGLDWYDYHARTYDPTLGRWFVVDALADAPEQVDKSTYAYAWNDPIKYNDPDGNCPKCGFGFSLSLRIGLNSNSGLSTKLNASAGFSYSGSNAQGVAFAGLSVYSGNQLGTSNLTGNIQFDATAGLYGTLGFGTGNSHVVNTLNADTPSGVSNDFRNSITYGQLLTYNSAINAERGSNDGASIQRLGLIGVKAFGDASFTTSNDTGIMGGGGTDKGQTGNGTLNFGGANGFSLSYENFTGSYNRSQEETTGFGSFYSQTLYQQLLNQSTFRLDAGGINLRGGTSDGSIQNAIHSVTNTGQFIYPNTTSSSSGLFNLFFNSNFK